MFMASWEEFSPSLEDMAVLTSLPLFGEAHAIEVTLKWGRPEEARVSE